MIALLGAAATTASADGSGPIEALYVTGGCCHDYDNQKQIIPEGITERLGDDAIEWKVIHEGGSSRDHKLSVFQEENWSEPYDVVVHNTCFGGTNDPEFIESFVAEHGSTGTAAIFLHCAMHSYRNQEKTDAYRKLVGVRSMSHESHRPLEVENLATEHPIMAEFPDDAWETPNGELYKIERVWPSVTPLAKAYGEDTGKDHLVAWTNEYKKARVFGTTLGHHNATMSHDVYLDMLTRGLLWSLGRPAAYTEMIDGQRWYRLFDGKSLDGWRVNEENPESIKVEDGRIVVDGPRTHLFYDGPIADANFKNFHFRAEVYTYPEANSGIFFHTRHQPSGWPSVGYEAQVNATHGDPRKTGSVYSVDDVMNDAPHENREWFGYEIIVDGDEITIKVDGETVTQYTEREEDIEGQRRLSSGTFALQAHDPNSRVYFRDIFIRPIDGAFEGGASGSE